MGRVASTQRRRRRIPSGTEGPKPKPPRGEDGFRVLARVRKALAAQRTTGLVFEPDGAERGVLEWLAFESGADLEMDRDPRYREAFAVLAKHPAVLRAIQDPALVADLTYPLDISDVVTLLQSAGLKVDLNAARRLADSFGVPRLGSGERRTFFARYVLEVASAILLEVTPAAVADLHRHLTLDLNYKERVLAPMFSEIPYERVDALARSRPLAIGRRTA